MSVISSELRSNLRDENLHDLIPMLEKLYSDRHPPLKPFLTWVREDVQLVFGNKMNPLTIEKIVSFLGKYQRELQFNCSLGTDLEDSDVLSESPIIKMKDPDSTVGISLAASLPANLFRRSFYCQSNSTYDLTSTHMERPSQPIAQAVSSYSISPSCSLIISPNIVKKPNIRKYRHKLCSSAPDLMQLQRMEDSDLSPTPRASNYCLRPPSGYSRHQSHSHSFSQRTPNPTSSLTICPFQFNNSRHSDVDQIRRWSATSSGYNTASPASVSTSSSCEKLNYLSGHQEYEPTSSIRHWSRTDSMGSEDDSHFKYRSLRSLSPDTSSSSQPLEQTTVWDTFRANFPHALQLMQDQLHDFIKYLNNEDKIEYFSKNQLIELAQSIQEASDTNQLTSSFFLLISKDLADILHRVAERFQTSNEVFSVIKQLLGIVSRPARLLECMEFDAEAYSNLMTNDMDLAKRMMCEDDLVPYLMRQLNSDLTNVEAKAQNNVLASDNTQQLKQPCETDFVRIKTISKGAYGIVLLARYRDTNRKFAMKKISKQRMAQKKLVPQVYAERDILSRVENPFIVSLLCTFTTRKHYCLVMEYVEGGDVASLIENIGPLPVDMARMYFSEAVLALEYVHSYGIIHRDLKPDNMLITSEGHIKLTDFGLSKIGLVTFTATMLETNMKTNKPSESHFKESTIWGTPDYIAPEVILGLEYDKAVDWWSMGVILYEMLAYFKPFKANTVEELFEIITDESYELTWPEEDLIERPPKDAEDLIRKLLTFQSKKRLGSCDLGGIEGVKSHPFFNGVDWNNLIRIKAEFIPQLEGEYDTSYFDTREDRYPEEYESDDGEEETDGDTGASQFASTSYRFSRLMEGDILDEICDLINTPIPPSFPKEDQKEILDSPGDKSIPDLSVLSDKDDGKSTEDEGVKQDDLAKLLSPPSGVRPNLQFPCITTSEQDLHSHDVYLPRTTNTNNLALLSVSEPELSFVSPDHGSPSELGKVDEIPVRYRTHTKSSSPSRLGSCPQAKNQITLKGSQVKSPKLKRQIPVNKAKPVFIESSPISPQTPKIISPQEPNSAEIEVEKCRNEFGFGVRGIRVYMKNSNNYQTDHLATGIVPGGPAAKGGLRENDLITHINHEEIRGYSHAQVAALLAHNKKVVLTIVPLHESSIQRDLKKRDSCDAVRIAKKSKTLKALFHTKKNKRGSNIFNKLPFSLPHRTSSASSTSSERERGGHTRAPSITSCASTGPGSPISHGSPVHKMKERLYNKKRPTPVSPLARTPSPSSLYRSTSLNLSQQKETHLMPPTQQTRVRTLSKQSKSVHPHTNMHNMHHSRVGRSRSQTNSDLKEHHHASSLDCSVTCGTSPNGTPRYLSPESQQTVEKRPRSATTIHSKSPQRHSNPVYYSNL